MLILVLINSILFYDDVYISMFKIHTSLRLEPRHATNFILLLIF